MLKMTKYQETLGAAGAEKIQVLRHFQHFPASACASKRAFLQLREEQNPSIFDQKLVGISRKEQKSEQDHPELIRNTAYYYSEVV